MEKINFIVKDVKGANFGINDIAIKKVYPPLVDETVIPTKEQQVLTHEGEYGYDTVTVEPIPDEYIIPEGTLPITENTIYDVTKFKRVSANVKPAPELQNKETTPTKETQNVTFDSGFDGLHTVTIKPIPDNYIEPTGTKEIKTEGTHDVTEYASVDVDVEPTLQDKQVTITENGTQNITADEGFDGLGNVEITTNAIEDLDEELNDYSNKLDEQEIKIDDIAEALKNKMLGDNADKSISELYYDGYSNFYDNFNGDYNKKYDTNEEIILYTPVEGYTHYFILYTSGKKYSIAWTPDTRQIGHVSYQSYWKSYDFVPRATVSINSISFWTNGVKQQKLSSFSGFLNINTSNSGINYYVSSEYNTLEECINAIKSSDTTYTNRTTDTYAVLPYGETMTPVVATNSIEIGRTQIINECGRQLSSKEKIVVIGTEA